MPYFEDKPDTPFILNRIKTEGTNAIKLDFSVDMPTPEGVLHVSRTIYLTIDEILDVLKRRGTGN